MTNYDHQPRKRFGQNFLHDQNIIHNIVASFNPKPSENILEIGPGLGALTNKILDHIEHLYVVEIDKDLAEQLKNNSRITVFNYDILKFDLNTLINKLPNSDFNSDSSLRIIGNLPYNISTPILFYLFNYINNIKDMLFMLQLEVVDRMVATEHTKDYGRLSVMTQFFCHTEKLFVVPKTAFRPAPKVTSAIVKLTPKNLDPAVDQQLLADIVRSAFNQRRKAITNSLKEYINPEILAQLNIDPKFRAEDLSVDTYLAIAKLIRKK
ncbi:MAG: 16S rRNA (adenine(1518)-N(6)/adenine(1519)-N(6))-dimethyltransferase RsmA [Gammaproteobacteria bacterium]|nr:16S rRNA (adenine(1518)-N(6)/adenine(1519)-N(6))-dimethyltransferase RsmA [Gammaproteobacteria bacterium]